jgi:hypothetical protein
MAIMTSIGTPTANSYVSVASADDYFSNYYQSEAWDEISSAASSTTTARTEKEGLLIQATREIDNTFRFYGSKYNTGLIGATDYQNLEFPRFDNTDNDGDIYILPEVKEATYQQALWVKLRRNKRFNAEGNLTNLPLVADEAYNYIKKQVNRQVNPTGNYPWQGSSY